MLKVSEEVERALAKLGPARIAARLDVELIPFSVSTMVVYRF